MSFFSTSGLLLCVTSLVMAIIMMGAGRSAKNILWACLCICMSFLGFGMYKIGLTNDPYTALTWWRLAYMGVVFTPVLVLHTVYIILGIKTFYTRWILIICYIISSIFFILNVSNILIEKVTWFFDELYFDAPMNLYFKLFLFYFNTIFTYIFYLLARAYSRFRDVNSEAVHQIKYFAIGIGFGAIGGYAVYFPLFGINIYPYGSILMSGYPIIIGYSIIKHHLFDARYAVLQILRMLAIIVVSLSVGGGLWLISELYFGYTPKIHPVELGIWITMYVAGIFLYDSQRFSRLFLISSIATLEHEVNRFLSKKSVYRDSLELLRDLEGFFQRGLKIHRVSILQESVTKKYKHTSEYFRKFRRPLILSELEAEDIEGESRDLIEEVRTMGRTIFPLELGANHDLLFLVIGEKESEAHMTEAEIMLVLRILPKIAMSLQILKFNHSLQKEVKKQTHSLDRKNRELAVAYERLQEADKNKDNFLAIASHELRTPMTIIKGYADLFLKNTLGPLSPDEAKYMQKIYDSTEALIELVNNILDISKIEAGRMEIVNAPMVFGKVSQNCIDNFRDLCKTKNITLTLTNSATSDTMITDESKFRVVLNNLLSNAYKFTPTGGKVTVQVREEEGKLFVQVNDTGVGIAESRLPYIFEKFNESANKDYTKKSIQGTGLGLNLSKQITALLGGSIHVESQPGHGTRFTLILPLSPYALL